MISPKSTFKLLNVCFGSADRGQRSAGTQSARARCPCRASQKGPANTMGGHPSEFTKKIMFFLGKL